MSDTLHSATMNYLGSKCMFFLVPTILCLLFFSGVLLYLNYDNLKDPLPRPF